MRTLEWFRIRYAAYEDEDLLKLLALNQQTLTPQARQALAEEAERRGGLEGVQERLAARPVIVLERGPKHLYTKANLGSRLGAYIVDRIVGMGPAIIAAIITFWIRLTPPNETIAMINLLATSAWGVYYGLTKDGREDGQSIGKEMFGLMVVNVKTNRPCRRGESVTRAFIGGLVGIVPLVGWLIEPGVAVWRDDGRRFGDQVADTQVIDAAEFHGTDLETD